MKKKMKDMDMVIKLDAINNDIVNKKQSIQKKGNDDFSSVLYPYISCLIFYSKFKFYFGII